MVVGGARAEHADMSRSGNFRAIFEHLDVDNSGRLEMNEVEGRQGQAADFQRLEPFLRGPAMP